MPSSSATLLLSKGMFAKSEYVTLVTFVGIVSSNSTSKMQADFLHQLLPTSNILVSDKKEFQFDKQINDIMN